MVLSDCAACIVAAADGKTDIEGSCTVTDGVDFADRDAVDKLGVGEHILRVDDCIDLDLSLNAGLSNDGCNTVLDDIPPEYIDKLTRAMTLWHDGAAHDVK